MPQDSLASSPGFGTRGPTGITRGELALFPVTWIVDGACSCGKSDCASPGKHPLVSGGCKAATTDAKQIAEWQQRWPDCNWGVATGSSLVVIDLDRKRGVDGVSAFRALAREHGGELPATYSVLTGGGGAHLYLRTSVPIACSVGKVAPGIDVRGEGGYVMAPGSDHVSGRSYEVARDLPIADMPAWLETLLTPAVTPQVQSPTERTNFGPASPEVLSLARAALIESGPAVQGSGGDDHTFWVGAMMRHNFALTEAEALPLFREWNLTCKPPWSEAGLLAKLRGGAKYAKGKFGDRRQVDVLTQVMALLDAYAQGGQDKTRLPELTAKINQIIATGIPQATWAVINHEIKIATTLTAKALGIGKPNALKAAGEARVAANPGGVIDPEYYDKQALAVLDPTRDEAGIPLLARWGEDFWKFNGAYYAPVSSEHIDVASRKWLGGKLDTKGDEVKACSHHVDEIRKALIGQITVTGGVAPAWRSDEPFPANEAICFANGVLRLTPRTWLPGPRRDLFSLSSTSFGFDPDAPTPARWLAFLNQIWPNDPEAISTLQEIFGLMLTTDTSFQKIFMVIGPRRSGKGTIARVLTELVGQTGVCHPTLGGLGQHFGLQGLIGKQLAVISDARLSAKSDVSQATEALLRISGEDGISIPRKNREDVALKLNVRFLLLTNELPYLYDSAGALAARFVILQMAHSFLGQETLDLTRRLLTELPGIALWALEGLERLYSRGRLVQPASGKQAMVELEEITSPIKAFVEDKCVIGPGISCAATEIYQAWCEWCAQSGRKETGTVQILGRNLKAAFPSVTSVRVGEGGQRRFGGVRVR